MTSRGTVVDTTPTTTMIEATSGEETMIEKKVFEVIVEKAKVDGKTNFHEQMF